MSTVVEPSLADVWERTIRPQEPNLAPEVARYFLEIRFDDRDRTRMNALAASAREGALSESESIELSNYMQMGWFLDLMKSKARISLRRSAPAS